MTATAANPPPVPPRKRMRLWIWHPRTDVGPKLVPVLRVFPGRGVVILDETDGKTYTIPAAWLFVPENAEGCDP